MEQASAIRFLQKIQEQIEKGEITANEWKKEAPLRVISSPDEEWERHEYTGERIFTLRCTFQPKKTEETK